MSKFITISFVGDKFHELEVHSSEEEAKGYSNGFYHGADKYGGNAWAATENTFWTEHVAEAMMTDWEYASQEEHAKAAKAIGAWYASKREAKVAS